MHDIVSLLNIVNITYIPNTRDMVVDDIIRDIMITVKLVLISDVISLMI